MDGTLTSGTVPCARNEKRKKTRYEHLTASRVNPSWSLLGDRPKTFLPSLPIGWFWPRGLSLHFSRIIMSVFCPVAERYYYRESSSPNRVNFGESVPVSRPRGAPVSMSLSRPPRPKQNVLARSRCERSQTFSRSTSSLRRHNNGSLAILPITDGSCHCFHRHRRIRRVPEFASQNEPQDLPFLLPPLSSWLMYLSGFFFI